MFRGIKKCSKHLLYSTPTQVPSCTVTITTSWPSGMFASVCEIGSDMLPPSLAERAGHPFLTLRPLHTCQIEIVCTASLSLRPIMAGCETGDGWRLTGESQANAQASALQRVARRLEARQINGRGLGPPEGDDGEYQHTNQAARPRLELSCSS